jgi:DNA-directed RNA polymerase specialized sigma24 family protein
MKPTARAAELLDAIVHILADCVECDFETRDELAARIRRLSEDELLFFLSYVINGLNCEQTAACVQVGVRAVQRRLKRLLLKLQEPRDTDAAR